MILPHRNFKRPKRQRSLVVHNALCALFAEIARFNGLFHLIASQAKLRLVNKPERPPILERLAVIDQLRRFPNSIISSHLERRIKLHILVIHIPGFDMIESNGRDIA